jgi:hypothetical protein
VKKILLFVLIGQIIVCGVCSGGGGGDGRGGNQSLNKGDQLSKKAVIVFSLISSQRLPFRMNGVEFTASLPIGMSVVVTGAKISSGLEAGNAVSNVLVSGSFVAQKIKLMISDTTLIQSGFGPGEVARLTCPITVGTTLSESDRVAFENEVVRTFKASGWDSRPSALVNPTSLKGYLQPKVAVVFTN